MSEPLVSVIIACYNQGRFLAEAIESVLSQTYPHVEVIVVNDGSADETPEVAARYGQRIKYIEQENAGRSAARNRGISAASGTLIATLDADDRWLPHKLDLQVPLFEEADVALVAGAYYSFYDGCQGHAGFVPAPAEADFHDILRDNPIGTLTAVFRRDLGESVGLFNTRFGQCEDWDLWLRLAARGRCLFVQEPVAEYRLHSANTSRQRTLMNLKRLEVLQQYADGVHPECAECRRAYREGIRNSWGIHYAQTVEHLKAGGLKSARAWREFVADISWRAPGFARWWVRRRLEWHRRQTERQ
jgi:glycosyltransferase involved in cell wall biosynthesis